MVADMTAIRQGMPVFGSDGTRIGTVLEARPDAPASSDDAGLGSTMPQPNAAGGARIEALGGSVRAEHKAETWPATGRVVRLRLYGLSMRELTGRSNGGTFIDRLAEGNSALFGLPADVPDLHGYIELAVRGGFPEPALGLSGLARQAWLDGYLDQSLTNLFIVDSAPA